jgi:hypothetical protein
VPHSPVKFENLGADLLILDLHHTSVLYVIVQYKQSFGGCTKKLMVCWQTRFTK